MKDSRTETERAREKSRLSVTKVSERCFKNCSSKKRERERERRLMGQVVPDPAHGFHTSHVSLLSLSMATMKWIFGGEIKHEKKIRSGKGEEILCTIINWWHSLRVWENQIANLEVR